MSIMRCKKCETFRDTDYENYDFERNLCKYCKEK